MKHKFHDGAVIADPTLGARQIQVVANSGKPDRVGDIIVASGVDLRPYKPNNVVLDGHDRMKPIGNADVYVAGEKLMALITFAPKGASPDADRVCTLAKAGVINAVSVGFRPIKSEAIRGGGERFLSSELLEISLVAIPCDPGALVIAQSLRGSKLGDAGGSLSEISALPRRKCKRT